MTTKEMIIKMKENEKNFIPLLEMFKRKAAKGLVEGTTPEQIEEIVKEIEREDSQRNHPVDMSDFSIVKTYAELSEAINSFEAKSAEYFKNLTENDWSALINLADDDMKNEIERLKPQKESLTEAVTFVGNNGELRTTTADEYNKETHEYHTETAILGLRKKKDESLDDEKILNTDIQSFINSELKKED